MNDHRTPPRPTPTPKPRNKEDTVGDFYCDDCIHLDPKEHEEVIKSVGHICKKHKKKGSLMVCLRGLGPKIVVVTDKNKLISCSDGDREYFLKPNKVKVVERTGAGDAFASGFVAGVIAGKTIPESLRLGLREGESVIRYFGAKNKLLRFRLR